ncbi:histidine acid phosphatase family protein [Xylariomycetidae sp. FL0641]|nr:histidine acid phosphatase family protein [Xylariomycetidae sp. FL0641]
MPPPGDPAGRQWQILSSPYSVLAAAAVVCGIAALQIPFARLDVMRTPSLYLTMLVPSLSGSTLAQDVDLGWYPPRNTAINNLDTVLHGTGVYGFIFNSSDTPPDQYGTYNWCNMPHVRETEYVRPPAEYELKYVEVIQRHHKRTPYAANSFPVETYRWDCDDQGLYHYGEPLTGTPRAAAGYWEGYASGINPFAPSGFAGTCQFPQITAGGLADAFAHGRDLYGVYHSLLLLPARDDDANDDRRRRVAYRVTQNPITSQVAGMLVSGTWGGRAASAATPLRVQAAGVDSLEPQYPCAAAASLFALHTRAADDRAWAAHLAGAAPLYARLDAISGVPRGDPGFHASVDHYFDNLSARQCHGRPLPCKPLVDGKKNSSECVDQAAADAVYRLGMWEYSHMYRGSPDALAASAASMGVWVAELGAHLRAAAAGGGEEDPVYVHNVAHDGSVSRVLSILQVDVMVWPGMGSEVVFELYEKKTGGHHVRVLFGGQVLKSSNPSLGEMDMLPLETLLAYFDGLVGRNASLVVDKCNGKGLAT